MHTFKALFNAVAAPLNYMSTATFESTPEATACERDRYLNLNFAAAGDHTSSLTPEAQFHYSIMSSTELFPTASSVESSAPEFYQAPGYPNSAGDRDYKINHNLTLVEMNRTIPYTMYPAIGLPIRFLIGQVQMPYDVHDLVLSIDSPAFEVLLSKPFNDPLALPSISPEEFGTLTKWLYTHIPPAFSAATELGHLVQLWVSASKLGLWQKANTLMRLGMELMAPRDRKCDIGIVRWVFSNTSPSSPLRPYIIAIFAQRSQPDESFFHVSAPSDVEIFRLTTAFMKKAGQAKRVLAARSLGSAWSVDAKGLPIFNFEVAAKWAPKDIDKFPLPRYLVWDERAEALPDKFFVFPQSEAFLDGLEEALKMGA